MKEPAFLLLVRSASAKRSWSVKSPSHLIIATRIVGDLESGPKIWIAW